MKIAIIGAGVAGIPYQIKSEACLLNLPASIMSIDVTKPDHFKDWLFQKGIPEYSIPRYIYGQYLRAL